jgi:hypothetical protein
MFNITIIENGNQKVESFVSYQDAEKARTELSRTGLEVTKPEWFRVS